MSEDGASPLVPKRCSSLPPLFSSVFTTVLGGCGDPPLNVRADICFGAGDAFIDAGQRQLTWFSLVPGRD